MPRFRVLPVDSYSSPALEFVAEDAANVLLIVGRLDCREADVLRDEAYSFSLRLDTNGTWCVFHREEQARQIPLEA